MEDMCYEMIVCERRVARRMGAHAVEEECESESNPKPRPKPKPRDSADVAERGVASTGVRSSGNLCVEYVYRALPSGVFLHVIRTVVTN